MQRAIAVHYTPLRGTNIWSFRGRDIAATSAMTPCSPLFRTTGRLTTSIGLACLLSACGGPLAHDSGSAATFPSDIPTVSGELDRRSSLRAEATFPLLNGSFNMTFRNGGTTTGTIAGRYTGSASQSGAGRAAATLSMRILRAGGTGSGVTALAVDGNGAFIGEGDFTLSFSFETSGGTTQMKVRGTSTISCSAEQRILATLTGTGSNSRLGDADVTLRHEVGNTFCSA